MDKHAFKVHLLLFSSQLMWNWWHGQEGIADYSFEVGKGSWIGSWISLIIALSLQSFGYSFRTRNVVGMPHIGLTDKRPVPCYTYKQLIHSSVQIKRHKVSLPHWHTFRPCMCKGQRDQCQEFGKGRGVFMCSYFCVIFCTLLCQWTPLAWEEE